MTTREFFQLLYPDWKPNVSRIDIMPMFPETPTSKKTTDRTKRRQVKRFTELDQLFNVIQQEDRHDLYFRCPELKPDAVRGRKEDRLRYPFLFADLDQKIKDAKGTVLKSYTKTQLWNKIESLELQPSIIVDSGNGFHLYWLLKAPLFSTEKAEEMIEALAYKIEGDRRGASPTQLLRVPNSLNRKQDPPLEVLVVEHSNQRYTHREMAEWIGVPLTNSIPRNETRASYNAMPRTQKALFEFDRLQPVDKDIESYQKLISYLKKMDMTSIMQNPVMLGHNFQCVMDDHEDSNPSANIFKNKQGHYYYKCFGCNTTLDIIGLYGKLHRKNFSESLLFFIRRMGLRLDYRDWVTDQLHKYHQNAVFIDNYETNDYDQLYPALSKLLSYRMHFLSLISHYAMGKISSETMSVDDHNLFFLSAEYFSRKYHKSISSTKRNMALLVTLGLIERVGLDRIPPAVAHKSIQEMKAKQDRYGIDQSSPVNFYIVPHLDEVLPKAEQIAQKLLDHKFKISNCLNKEFLIRVFGQDMANRVFPDDRKESKEKTIVSEYLEKTLLKLIKTKGYATKKDIASKTNLPGKMKFNASQKQKEVDRFIGQWLLDHHLKYVCPSDEQQKRLKLKNRGYIIVPSD